jgi:hypothetical protein
MNNQPINMENQIRNTSTKFSEIQEKYPDTFVLLKDVVSNGAKVIEGVLIYKNKNQDKVWAKLRELRGTLGQNTVTSIEYTGGKLDEQEYIFIL